MRPLGLRRAILLPLIFSVFFFDSSASATPSKNKFLPIGACKLKSQDDELSPSNALRTGIKNLQTTGKIQILILRIDFLDLPLETKPDFEFPKLISKLDDYYARASGGKLEILGSLHGQAMRMPKSIKEYSAVDRNSLSGVVEIARDALGLLLKEITTFNFDYVIIATPSSTRVEDISTSISYLDDGSLPNATLLAGDYWQAGRPWTIPAHELGHAFGLHDLYSYENATVVSNGLAPNATQFEFMGIYELMNRPMGPGPELGAWNRWQLGYLSKKEVGCIGKGRTVSTLNPITKVGNRRALFIKLDESRLLVIENRQRTGFDKNLPTSSVGLIVYLVDLKQASGEGQQRILAVSNKEGFGKFTVQQGERVIYDGITIKNVEFKRERISVLVQMSYRGIPRIERALDY